MCFCFIKRKREKKRGEGAVINGTGKKRKELDRDDRGERFSRLCSV